LAIAQIAQTDSGKVKQPPDEINSADDSKNLLSFVPVGAYRLRERLRLKKAVCYPDDEDVYGDEEVAEALEAVGLGKLLEAATPGAENLEEEEAVNSSTVTSTTMSSSSCPALYDDHGDRMLSAGEAQRLELAHVLLTRPQWCFLDEPVSHVKEEEREKLFSVLRSRLRGVSTLVTITHDVTALSPLHDSILELREGQLRRIDDIAEL